MNYDYRQLTEVIDSPEKVNILLEEFDNLGLSQEYRDLHLNRLLVEYMFQIPMSDLYIDIVCKLIEVGADAKMKSGKGLSLINIILYQFKILSYTRYLYDHMESYKKILDILVKHNLDLDYKDEVNKNSIMRLARELPPIYKILVGILDKYSVEYVKHDDVKPRKSKTSVQPKALVEKHEPVVVKKKMTTLDKAISKLQKIKKNMLG